MKPAPFDYHRASSIEEAADLLAQTGGKVLAGGQSLVPLMSMRLASPRALVDINGVPALDRIDVDDAAVRIGATVRHRALELHDSAFAANPLLRQALCHVAHPTIRNRGTTVGSLVHADPAAEMPAVLALLAGDVEVVRTGDRRRTIPAGELFVGPLESSLAADEVAVAASFPNPPPGSGTSWVELSRRRGDYALVGVGAVVALTPEGILLSARLALVSVAATPIVVDVSQAAGTTSYDEIDWSDAIDQADAAIDPEADIHASADYRRRLARVLARRALDEALAAAVPAPVGV
ncbi:MAG: FAD binding domain-containing protein [Actinomycetota bacterium]|nr:FAD binding domain-containing protein [Actinomycetota bacterium]